MWAARFATIRVIYKRRRLRIGGDLFCLLWISWWKLKIWKKIRYLWFCEQVDRNRLTSFCMSMHYKFKALKNYGSMSWAHLYIGSTHIDDTKNKLPYRTYSMLKVYTIIMFILCIGYILCIIITKICIRCIPCLGFI